jgi:hypothetical protein
MLKRNGQPCQRTFQIIRNDSQISSLSHTTRSSRPSERISKQFNEQKMERPQATILTGPIGKKFVGFCKARVFNG